MNKLEYSVIRFGMYRILGNDLPPRHHENQTIINLKFQLEHEKDFPDTQKRYCVNRIWDPIKRATILGMLKDAGVGFFEIPFDKTEYLRADSLEEKLMYLTNVNPARNHCLGHSRLSDDDVAVILDGGTFVRKDGWEPFESIVYEFPPIFEGAYAIPCCRVATLEEVLQDEMQWSIRETYEYGGGQKVTGTREMYLALTKNCDVQFNETLPYGRVDKVYTMWQLGMIGPWDRWHPDIRQEAYSKPSKFSGSVKMGGYAIRLPSHSNRDGNNLDRGMARNNGINLMVSTVDNLIGTGKL